MPDIRILPEIISNKIAAGEVVERPVSVVKELVENALDAGATQIVVEVKKGGRDLIRVTDNGHGMTRDNALLAIERYATSKITKDDDLFAISSFGFRGEALPSMASVSKFTLVSRTETSDAAVSLRMEGGRLRDVTEVGAPVGTLVEVRDLYFNTPARRKFLKSINTEMGHIADSVVSIALAFPHVAFRLIHNGRIVKHFTSADDLQSRVRMVLGMGREDLENLYPVNPHLLDLLLPYPGFEEDSLEQSQSKTVTTAPVKVTGYVGAPSLNRSSGGKIILFVNRRVVSDRTMVSAILRGYKGRLMKGRFPVAALFLSVPYDEVDVNVHPAKLQVRFLNQGTVFATLSSAVHQALFQEEQRYADASSFHLSSTEASDEVLPDSDLHVSENHLPPALFNEKSLDMEERATEVESSPDFSLPKKSLRKHENPEQSLFEWGSRPEPVKENINGRDGDDESLTPPLIKTLSIAAEDGQSQVSEALTFEFGSQASVESSDLDDVKSQTSGAEPHVTPEIPTLNPFFSSLHIVGQIFDTYIVAHSPKEMILIDQHAAHERVVFEKLKSRSTAFRPPSQQLIVPELLELNYKEAAMVEIIIPTLCHLGIEMEPFGEKSFLIKSIPAIIDDKELKPLVLDILDALTKTGIEEGKGDGSIKEIEGREIVISSEGREWLDEILLLISCHHSVRAHHRLDKKELDALLSDLDRCGSPFHCPHGRPITLSFSQKELERKFKRTGS